MKVLANSLYLVDYQLNSLKKIEIPENIPLFIQDLIEHVTENKSVKNYLIRSNTTQVVNDVTSLVNKLSPYKSIKENETPENHEIFEDIANRLLFVEKKVQSEIKHLGQNVKKGSLIQAAVFFEDSQKYAYFIAKVNHTDFIDDTDFSLKTGFLKQEKYWKSCMFDVLKHDGEIEIDGAKIFLDNVAKYWADKFLELDELTTDEINTKTAFSFVDITLIHNVKRKAPSDYWVLRNYFVGYLKRVRQVSYTEMINETFSGYSPIELTEDDLSTVKTKLLDENKWKFDPMFESVPSAIRAKIKTVFPVTSGIDLNIKESVPDIKAEIQSFTADGKRYLRIHTTNEETYAAFKR